jgi:hypothetical protein
VFVIGNLILHTQQVQSAMRLGVSWSSSKLMQTCNEEKDESFLYDNHDTKALTSYEKLYSKVYVPSDKL